MIAELHDREGAPGHLFGIESAGEVAREVGRIGSRRAVGRSLKEGQLVTGGRELSEQATGSRVASRDEA